MSAYKVIVHIDGRNIESFVKENIIASVETGIIDDGVEIPETKISIIAGMSRNEPSAWLQVGRYDRDKVLRITHEGWINAANTAVRAIGDLPAIVGSVHKNLNPEENIRKCHESVEFGVESCCTGTSGNCYVKCCGGCCSDPVKCPGASCCP